MRRVPPTAPRVARAAALAAAAAALLLAVGGPGALAGPLVLVLVAVACVPFLEWSPVPAPLVRALPRVTGFVLLTTALVAWLSRSLGTLVLEPSLFPRVAGPVLLAVALAFALAPRAFPPGRAQLPALIGVLCAAGLDPQPDGFGPSALPFLRAGEHNAFAERYLALAVAVLVALWASALLESGPRWSRRAAATLALSLVAAAALAATGIAGLPLAQPHVERAVASTFIEATTGLSGESRLGEFAELAVSRRRVLDLQTSLPGGGAWLLPSEVLTQFDGQAWKPAPASPAPRGAPGSPLVLRPTAPPPSTGPLLDGLGRWFETQPAPAAGVVEMRVTQSETERWPLLLPRGTRGVTADAWDLALDAHGLLRRPDGQALRLYGATWSGEPGLAALAVVPSEAEREAALSLPPRVDPRLVALAREIASTDLATSDGSGRLRVAATLAHLTGGGYRYTLAPGAFRTDDPVAEFLFEKKAAYCEYFATAAVLLLRLQGVPARFVKGLSVGPHSDQGGGLHVVRESAAHAWVEAWVEGEGWVELDPTPPGDFAAAHPPPSSAGRLVEQLRAAVTTAWRRLVDLGPMAFFRGLAHDLGRLLGIAARSPEAWVAAFVVVLGLAARRLWRAVARLRGRARAQRDPGAEAVPSDLRALVQELERRWARAGRARPAARGLLEHARRMAAASGPTPLPTGLAEAGTRIVEAYYRARFGGDVPSGPQLEALRTVLGSRAGPAPASGA